MSKNRWGWFFWSGVGCALASTAQLGCSDSSSEPGVENTSPVLGSGVPESVYQRERRIEVAIELPDEDWQKLRQEGRSMAEILSAVPTDYTYQEYRGQVTVDGVAYADVGVKKKGFIGSLSVLRPSLRLDFDPSGFGLASGLRRLTLNADVQDRSHARQCMAFDLFQAAGLPASRCGFAHVTVNGVDLGTYTNVEPINKAWLRRQWGDDTGNLYEGTLADFDEEGVRRIELETNTKTDKEDVQALVRALGASDGEVVTELESRVDLDQFRDFWAMETLLGHWDGYAETANNYYLYFEPGRQRFVFIPWGLDQAFTGQRAFDTLPYEISVYARARLSRRLYDLPEQRAAFRARLAELTESLWDEAALLESAAAIDQLIPDDDPQAVMAHRTYLQTHGDELRAALELPAPEIVGAPQIVPSPCAASTPISGSFSVPWMAEGGTSSISLELDGQPIESQFVLTGAPDVDASRATLSANGALQDGRGLAVLILLPTNAVTSGTLPFHSFETFGLVASLGPPAGFNTLGLFGDGEIRFEAASQVENEPVPNEAVTGTFEAVFYQQACLGSATAE